MRILAGGRARVPVVLAGSSAASAISARPDRRLPAVARRFGVWNGYFILFEGLRRGQTPGKRMAGIRVVRDTGHAVTFGAAAAPQPASGRRLPPPALPDRRACSSRSTRAASG